MDITLHGTPPTGASVTSGAISAVTAIGAGDITINTVAMPAIGASASNEARVDALVAAINSLQNVTGVFATKVTATTYKLQASADIVIAALAGTATAANCGLTAGTTSLGARMLMDTRKAFGSNATPGDFDVVKVNNGWMDLYHAEQMGLVKKLNGTYIEIQPAQTPTRTDA